jgi:hypothetical protein
MSAPEGEDRNSWSQGQWVPPAFKWPKMTEGEFELVRKRQRDRARVTALLLGAFVILLFFITIAKTGINW